MMLGLVLITAALSLNSILWLGLSLLYLYLHYQSHWGRGAVNSLHKTSQGLWTLNQDPGYELLPSSSVRRYWAVLYFQKPGARIWERKKIVAVFPDCLGREEFRRLRIYCWF